MGNVLHRVALTFLLGSFGLAFASDAPIAGVKPYQRPAGAPVVTSVDKTGGWYERALTGISEPYPASLGFLEDQGNWYTPFIHPGMSGRYDIRGWRRPSAPRAAK